MTRLRILVSLLVVVPQLLVAQNGTSAAPSADRPGRDPKQPIDEEYTKKILEYTTEKFFLSPLVDYLPASRTVPTPKVVLGDIAGAPNKLPYSKEVYDYMRRLDAASPRVRVYSIGQTEEGREMIAVAVASEALMNRLDENKANLAKLADPRTINMNDAEAARLAATTAPVYYITGTIHSPEAGAPTALMELAYRLAVDESPYIRHIRDNLITLITPIVEVDGRDRQVDIFNWHMKYPDRTWPGLIYWGKYVAHDNNRDAMGVTLKLTENVLNTYVDWKAQVLHDLHESVPYLYDNTIGDGPYNAWVDPLLTNEWHMIGWNNVQEMTRLGMPGVFAFGAFDTWSPGYLMFIAATHNGISRLYETFGNGGSAETLERTLSENQTSRTWYRQNPPLPRVKWSLRNNNNYEQTGVLVSLNYFANNKRLFLQNFYEKSKRSILKAKTEGPAAYVLPANDPRPGAQAELLRVMQKQRVEISRATAAFTVKVPARRPQAQATGQRDTTAATARRDSSAASRVTSHESRTSQRAATSSGWTSRTRASPTRCSTTSTGHLTTRRPTRTTTPGGRSPKDSRRRRSASPTRRCSKVAGRSGDRARSSPRVASPVPVTRSSSTPTATTQLITLRYRFRSADFQAAEEPFDGGRAALCARLVHHSRRRAGRPRQGGEGTRPQGRRPPPARPREDASRARGARRAHAHLGQHADRRLVAPRVRQAADPVRVHQHAGSVARRQPAREVRRHPLPARRRQRRTRSCRGWPMWRNPMPWKNSPETPNIGTYAQTDDIRPGTRLERRRQPRSVREAGRRAGRR